MNDRNLNYIKKLNPKSSINLADNKVETKLFLHERGIGVARTIAIISSKKELSNFDLNSIKDKYFVIKPVSGSKGNGILIVEKLGNSKYKISGKERDQGFLIDHMYDILNGDFSLNYGYDKVLIEEKLIPGSGFDKFCEYGLADIRLIVYNMVPVAAMVRMPTQRSEGKANLAQGGIGLGVKVGSGKIFSFYQDGKVITADFPVKYGDLKNFYIPFWDDVLEASSKTQFYVNLGYLALDWVITDSGPKILEINARAGIEIQNVSLLPLKKRLDKLKDLRIQEPEKGVELAKSLFSEKVSTGIGSGKIIYLEQYADLIISGEKEEILLKLDLKNKKNYISKDLGDLLQKNDYILEFGENIVFENLKFKVDETLEENTFVLGTNTIKDFFIKPISNLEKERIFLPEKINKNELNLLKSLDEKISKLDKRFSLTNSLRPINFLSELDKFIELKGNYNPQFEYNFLSDEKVLNIKKTIDSIKDSYFKKGLELKSEFSKIYLDKLNEIEYFIDLIEAYKNQNYEKIDKLNKKLYGEFDEKLFSKSKEKTGNLVDKTVLGKILDINYVVDYIRKYLEENHIDDGVRVVLYSANASRISINRRKSKIEIRVDTNAIIREKELDGIIAHEIGVHLNRYLNGKKTGWEIFTLGTANYLTTEEGLAVYNSLKHFPEDYEKVGMYQNYYLVEMAKKLDFKELAELVFKLYGNDFIKVFKTTFRFKKGIKDTSVKNKSAYYGKDKVYLDGYTQVKKWVKDGGNIEKLMIGKIKIEDLEYI